MSAGQAMRGRVGWHDAAGPTATEGLSQAETSLLAAKDCERAGRLDDAIRGYEAAVASPGERRQDAAARAEALRRHASILRRRQEYEQAAALCRQSYDVAIAMGLTVPAANALNGLGIVHSECGEWSNATQALDQALAVGGHDATLRTAAVSAGARGLPGRRR
jgi:tetratricopeptide (TPR) repeat protein